MTSWEETGEFEEAEETTEVAEEQETSEEPAPRRPGFGKRLGGWMGRHKKLLIFVVVLAVVAGGVFAFVVRPRMMMKAQSQNQNVAFIRTTTLQKTSLSDSISSSGLVASSNVSTVTTNLNASVKTVEVAVGDYVEEGDVICTLDTENIQKQITRAQERITDSIEAAQEKYENAARNWRDAKELLEDYEDAEDDARKEYKAIKEQYETALELIEDLQDEVSDCNEAWNDAKIDLARANKNLTDAQNDGADSDEITALEQAVADAVQAEKDAYDALDTASKNYDDMDSLTGYSTLYKNYTTAKNAYDTASERVEDQEERVLDLKETMEDAQEAIADAEESDDLEDLYDELEDYTLKAETAGYVTSLNATVGSRLSEATVATIQDTDDLIINISIAEYDIDSVSLGMKAIITSDSIEGEATGTLTQIDPVASGGMSESATFSAEVSVDGADSGLIIGVNAKVQLIVSSVDDVFVVPYDAVEEKADGSKIVYVKTGGSGVDATFEELEVQTGAETDYYIEIMGDGLSEGMEIRSSADLTQATFTQQEGTGSDSAMGFDMGGMTGGGMPSGGGMPGGGGGMPGGGGGGMPGGMR